MLNYLKNTFGEHRKDKALGSQLGLIVVIKMRIDGLNQKEVLTGTPHFFL